MNFFKYLGIFLAIITLQGCSLFNAIPDCNHKNVKDSVKKMYASQVNPKPLTDIDYFQQQFNPNYQNLNVKLQSTAGIDLVSIKAINIEQLQNKPNKSEDDEQMLTMIKSLEGAKYVCEGIIQQQIYGESAKSLIHEIGDEANHFIENSRLKLPVLYAVHHEDGSEQYEVSYSLKNRVHAYYAMMINQSINDEINRNNNVLTENNED